MWFRYETGLWWRHTRGMSAEEKGRFADAMNEALEDRRRGLNPIADKILDEADVFSQKRRQSAISRWGRGGSDKPKKKDASASARDASASECMQVHPFAMHEKSVQCHTNIPTDRPTDKRTDKQTYPEPRTPSPAGGGEGRGAGRSDGVGSGKKSMEGGRRKHPLFDSPEWSAAFAGDKYGTIAGIEPVLLPEFAAWYCEEPGNQRAVRRYAGFVKRQGAEAFRDLLAVFVGDVEAGEEPDNRGMAFMARVARAEESA